jgi:hypothetical protein
MAGLEEIYVDGKWRENSTRLSGLEPTKEDNVEVGWAEPSLAKSEACKCHIIFPATDFQGRHIFYLAGLHGHY